MKDATRKEFEKSFHEAILSRAAKTSKNVTFKEWINVGYRSQARWSLKNNTPITYKKEELIEWVLVNPAVLRNLLKNWARSDFDRKYRPAFSRKNYELGFNLDNIELLPYHEANLKGLASEKTRSRSHFITCKGDIEKRPVRQIDPITLEILKVWPIVTGAEKALGLRKGDISDVCKRQHDRLTAAGFLWEYEELPVRKTLF